MCGVVFVGRLVRRLISRLVAVFIYFLLKDQHHQSITNSTNDLGVNVEDPKACEFR